MTIAVVGFIIALLFFVFEILDNNLTLPFLINRSSTFFASILLVSGAIIFFSAYKEQWVNIIAVLGIPVILLANQAIIHSSRGVWLYCFLCEEEKIVATILLFAVFIYSFVLSFWTIKRQRVLQYIGVSFLGLAALLLIYDRLP